MFHKLSDGTYIRKDKIISITHVPKGTIIRDSAGRENKNKVEYGVGHCRSINVKLDKIDLKDMLKS